MYECLYIRGDFIKISSHTIALIYYFSIEIMAGGVKVEHEMNTQSSPPKCIDGHSYMDSI